MTCGPNSTGSLFVNKVLLVHDHFICLLVSMTAFSLQRQRRVVSRDLWLAKHDTLTIWPFRVEVC